VSLLKAAVSEFLICFVVIWFIGLCLYHLYHNFYHSQSEPMLFIGSFLAMQHKHHRDRKSTVFLTGQSVHPEGGRRWTALSGSVLSFSIARRPGARDYTPAIPREKWFMSGWEMFLIPHGNHPQLVRNPWPDCLHHPIFPNTPKI